MALLFLDFLEGQSRLSRPVARCHSLRRRMSSRMTSTSHCLFFSRLERIDAHSPQGTRIQKERRLGLHLASQKAPDLVERTGLCLELR